MNIDKIEVMENDKGFIIYPKEHKVFVHNTYFPIKNEKIQYKIKKDVIK